MKILVSLLLVYFFIAGCLTTQGVKEVDNVKSGMTEKFENNITNLSLTENKTKEPSEFEKTGIVITPPSGNIAQDEYGYYMADRILIGFKENVTDAYVLNLTKEYTGKITGFIPGINVYEINVSGDLDKIIKELSNHTNIKYVEKNYFFGDPGKRILDVKNECSSYAQLLIQEMNLTKVNTCVDEEYLFNGIKAHKIGISYGPGMDCPSGCIYDYYTAVVTKDKKIYEIEEITPVEINSQLSKICVNQNNLDCYYDPIVQYDGDDRKFSFEENFKISTMLDEKGIYWLINFSDIKGHSGDCRKVCDVNGKMKVRRDDQKYGAIKVEFSNITTQLEDFVDCNLDVYKNYCIFGLAAAQNDPNLCEKIEEENDESRTSKLNNCYAHTAFMNEEPEYCEKIKSIYDGYDEKHECFINLVMRTHNASICERFNVVDTKYSKCKSFASWEHLR